MGRWRSMVWRSRSVQLFDSTGGVASSRLLVVAILSSLRVWEWGEQRDREEDDHPTDHEQVRHRDEDESPVKVSRRCVHACPPRQSAMGPILSAVSEGQ